MEWQRKSSHSCERFFFSKRKQFVAHTKAFGAEASHNRRLPAQHKHNDWRWNRRNLEYNVATQFDMAIVKVSHTQIA